MLNVQLLINHLHFQDSISASSRQISTTIFPQNLTILPNLFINNKSHWFHWLFRGFMSKSWCHSCWCCCCCCQQHCCYEINPIKVKSIWQHTSDTTDAQLVLEESYEQCECTMESNSQLKILFFSNPTKSGGICFCCCVFFRFLKHWLFGISSIPFAPAVK